MKLHYTNITVGLLAKVLKACNKTFQDGALTVTIQNRHYEPILHVKRVKIKSTNKFIIVDNYGQNMVSLLFRGASTKKGLRSGMVRFIVKNFLWSHEVESLERAGIKC